MDDLISRQAAIETLLKGKINEDESLVECPEECNAMIDGAIEDIKALPSAQPERKKGKWVRKEIHSNWSDWTENVCSLCGATFKRLYKANFCPNCGAVMDEEELETTEEDWYRDEWRDEWDERGEDDND